jgi:fumarate reductase subunit D
MALALEEVSDVMARRPPIEPLLWLLFSAGGVLSALLVPVLLLLFGVAYPLGWLTPPSHEAVLELFSKSSVLGWVVRVTLFLLCWLGLFHWAHRFRYTLYDGLQIKHLNEMINVLCYGGAIIGTIVAGYLLWPFP